MTFAARSFLARRGASDTHIPSGSVRSEQRSLAEKELPPKGLRRIWAVAALLVGHSPTLRGMLLLAPCHRPNWAQRTSSYLCLRPLSCQSDGLALLNHLLQFGQGKVLDLADSLSSDAELAPDFFEGHFVVAGQSESVAQDGLFSRGQGRDQFAQQSYVSLVFQFLVRILRLLVLHQVAVAVGILLVADWGIERGRANRGRTQLRHLLRGSIQFRGQFLIGRFAAKYFLQLDGSTAHVENFVA